MIDVDVARQEIGTTGQQGHGIAAEEVLLSQLEIGLEMIGPRPVRGHDGDVQTAARVSVLGFAVNSEEESEFDISRSRHGI
jgi:hypothetical protein